MPDHGDVDEVPEQSRVGSETRLDINRHLMGHNQPRQTIRVERHTQREELRATALHQ